MLGSLVFTRSLVITAFIIHSVEGACLWRPRNGRHWCDVCAMYVTFSHNINLPVRVQPHSVPRFVIIYLTWEEIPANKTAQWEWPLPCGATIASNVVGLPWYCLNPTRFHTTECLPFVSLGGVLFSLPSTAGFPLD